jgi:biotin carboxyl carrier protein
LSRYYVKLADREIGIELAHSAGCTTARLLDADGGEPPGTVDIAPVHANVETGEGLYSLLVNGKSYQIYVAPSESGLVVQVSRHRVGLRVLTEREWRLDKLAPKQAVFSGKTDVTAPMPGLVKGVLVQMGAEVKVGDRLVVLEAMKMENEITSPRDGRVTAVHVTAGVVVDGGKALVTIE